MSIFKRARTPLDPPLDPPLAFFHRTGYLMKETGEWKYEVDKFPFPSIGAERYNAFNLGFDRDGNFDPEDEDVDYTEVKYDYVNECPVFNLEEMAGYYQTAVTGDRSWVARPESKFNAKVWLWNYANRNGLTLAAAEKVILDEIKRQEAANDAIRAERYARGL